MNAVRLVQDRRQPRAAFVRAGRLNDTNPPMWTVHDLEIELEDELTDGQVVTARIATPGGVLLVMTEVEQQGCELTLDRLHMHGERLGPNELGPHRLRQLANAFMEWMDLDAVIVKGAARTSGARRGNLPRPLRFTRKVYAPGRRDVC
jgi:hypothetical protein